MIVVVGVGVRRCRTADARCWSSQRGRTRVHHQQSHGWVVAHLAHIPRAHACSYVQRALACIAASPAPRRVHPLHRFHTRDLLSLSSK